MNGLIALVLLGLLFVAVNGAWGGLIQRAALPLYRARLVGLAPAARATWLAALLALPPALTLALLLPVVVGAAAGWLPVTTWCRRLHAHCDLLLGSESATEILVYALAGLSLSIALGAALMRLGGPVLWARRHVGMPLKPAEQATLDSALAQFAALGQIQPRVVVIPTLGGGAAVLGLRRAVVVLSAELLASLSPDELYAVLRHECAHFRRRDGLWSLGIALGRCLSLWPTAGGALATAWHQDREILCDRDAVGAGADPIALAQSLITAARLPRRPHPWWAPALVGGADCSLTERVHRLLGDCEPETPADTRMALLVSAGLVALTALLAALCGEPLLSLHCLVEEGVHLLS